jgi:HEAT repeat protein
MSPRRRSIRIAAVAMVGVALGAGDGPARAQPRVMVGTGPARPAERKAESNALRAQLGVPLAQRLLVSDDLATRIRGIERLGAIGTSEAIDALVDAMDQSSVAARDPRARLVAVRALAGEAKRKNVRKLLYDQVSESAGADALRPQQPLAAVVRSTAALALARSGDKDAIGLLAGAAQQLGPAAEVALHALRSYPPASLESLLDGNKRLTPALATLLGELGDLRAIDRVHPLLADGDTAMKLTAAVALSKLGDVAALPLAREWVKKSEPRLRRAGAQILVTLDARDKGEADAAIVALLDADSTREDGIRLALAAPSPALGPALVRLLPTLPADQRDKVIAALGRARVVAPLVPLLDGADTRVAAVFAIATAPGADARGAIEQALAGDKGRHPDTRRLLVRAGVVRALWLDDPPAGLEDRLRALYAASDPADRAAGAFGLVALGALSPEEVLRAACQKDPNDPMHGRLACDARATSAARGALALPDGASSLASLMPWLVRAAAFDPSAPSSVSVALGAALLASPDGGDLPTSTLAAWAEAGGPLAPLAARALPARDDEALRGRIKRLLESGDPVVRAHVALGLGHDPEPSAVSLLTSAYRFEDDAGVRRAIVRGLSRRTEVQRTATLTLARDLDPDDETRALARAALDGRVLDPGARPALGVEPRRGVAWITVESSDAPAPGAPRDDGTPRLGPSHVARLVRADGLAIPAVPDPDGALLVPGLVPGAASLQLSRGDAPRLALGREAREALGR